jgi:hypothetical protein
VNARWSGPFERLRYYARQPLNLLPTTAKRSMAAQTNRSILAGEAPAVGQPTLPAESSTAAVSSAVESMSRLDRTLRLAFLFSPLRFGVQTAFNPWNPIPSTGLHIPTRFIIAHLLHTPHPTAVWDVQLIQPDPGGLDEMERELDLMEGPGVKPRLYRAMAGRPGYYDYLRDLTTKARRFDYPATPATLVPTFQNLVLFLNFASEL